VALYETLWIHSLPLIAREDALWPSPLRPADLPYADPPADAPPITATTPPDTYLA
jgi:hypothetical protein